ncbi:MAG: peptidase S8, partial [Planctomycetales bacterium]|nr:peptidase S8 [Planctomycetales bacterium]NIP69698.1 peptidase S8 [Planctomycetales bacterium]
VGAAYSQTLTASGGTPPLTWALAPASGPLPDGLSLDTGGVISGIPTAAGTFNFTVRVTDTNGVFGDRALSILINPALVIATTTLPQATVGGGYSQTLVATGGTLPLSWSLAPASGPLPAGLSLSTDGVISGTPTTAGTFNFTVRVTDINGAFADQPLSILVNPQPTIDTT